MPLTRRQFLQGAGALSAAAAVGSCTERRDETSPDTAAPATTGPPVAATGTLVVVTLYGGNDALSTVAPVHDGTYRALRGDLAVDPTTAHDVGEGFALHPALGRCKALWDEDRLAIVHGVGFEGLDRSHFHCMDVWQAGSTDDHATGWVGRWLDAVDRGPLDAVVVGPNLPLLARGARRSAAVVPSGPFELPGDKALHDLLAGHAEPAADPPTLRDLAARSANDLLTVAATVSPAVADLADADTLGARLETVARLLEAGLPTLVYATAFGGFDTHASQGPTHATLLAELDAALGDFIARVPDRDVTVLVCSEFGRRVAPNASGGTDHGGAGTVLLAGNVRPGHHGEPPSLRALTDGDLTTTVDFRAVYGGLLEGVLGIEAGDVLDAPPPPLQIV